MDHGDVDARSAPQQEARRRIRTCELKAAADYFTPNRRVLDYGAGSGFVSSLIAELGCDVEAIDVDTRPWMYWPVSRYDGVRLPYPDAAFDVVFSCFSLEHLPDLPTCLREMTRVLKRDGTMIHIVPTFSWRFWSNVMHYVRVLRQVPRRFGIRRPVQPEPAQQEPSAAVGRRRKLWRVLIPPSHGDLSANALTEMAQYFLSRWRRRFSEASLDIIAERPTGVFDVEYLLLADISIRARQILARVLGSSGYVFVLRSQPSGGTPAVPARSTRNRGGGLELTLLS